MDAALAYEGLWRAEEFVVSVNQAISRLPLPSDQVPRLMDEPLGQRDALGGRASVGKDLLQPVVERLVQQAVRLVDDLAVRLELD